MTTIAPRFAILPVPLIFILSIFYQYIFQYFFAPLGAIAVLYGTKHKEVPVLTPVKAKKNKTYTICAQWWSIGVQPNIQLHIKYVHYKGRYIITVDKFKIEIVRLLYNRTFHKWHMSEHGCISLYSMCSNLRTFTYQISCYGVDNSWSWYLVS